MGFKRMTKDVLNVSKLADVVKNQASYIKSVFDQSGKDLKEEHNGLLDQLEADTSASNLGAKKNGVKTTIQAILDSLLTGKQDVSEGKGLSTEDFTTEEKEKLAGIEEGANKYDLPEATGEVLGGVRLGTTVEVVNGKLEAKGLPAPDEVARDVINKHTADETIHMTAEQKISIRELQPISAELVELNEKLNNKADNVVELADVSEKLLNSVDTGVSGIVEANSLIFNVTPDMVGKRILCTWNMGRQINLPSPEKVGKGAFIEIQGTSNDASNFIEVYTSEKLIYKEYKGDTKCIQPAKTTRRYYSDGGNWFTNFEKVSFEKTVAVNIRASTGSDTEMVHADWVRLFKNVSQVKYLTEYKSIRVRIFDEVELTEDLYFSDIEITFWSMDRSLHSLSIPSDYKIYLKDSTVKISGLTLKAEGVVFECLDKTNAIMVNVNIQPLSNNSFYLFNLTGGGMENSNMGSALLTTSFGNCKFLIGELTEYTANSNIINAQQTYWSKAVILIDLSAGVGWGSKIDNVKWCNNSDTLSRIGTSGLYTVG